MIACDLRISFISCTVMTLLAGAAHAQPVPAMPQAAPAQKNDEWLFVGAGQVGGQNNSYGTVGVVAPLPGSQLGNGWVARVFADEVSYRFRGSRNQKVDAQGYGGSATVGYMVSDDKGWAGLYAGPAYRFVDLKPNDPTSKASGATVSARIQAEGERFVAQDTKMNVLGGTDISDNTGYWARGRVLQRVEGDIFIGPEGFVMGDQDYRAYQVGVAVVGMHLTDKTQIGINGGYRKTEDQDGAAYGGLELGSRF